MPRSFLGGRRVSRKKTHVKPQWGRGRGSKMDKKDHVVCVPSLRYSTEFFWYWYNKMTLKVISPFRNLKRSKWRTFKKQKFMEQSHNRIKRKDIKQSFKDLHYITMIIKTFIVAFFNSPWFDLLSTCQAEKEARYRWYRRAVRAAYSWVASPCCLSSLMAVKLVVTFFYELCAGCCSWCWSVLSCSLCFIL